MIGGINSAAQELGGVRRAIAEIEKKLRGPRERPTITLKPNYPKGRRGLSHDAVYRGVAGELGTDNFGRWYAVVAGDIVASGLPSMAAARDAFAQRVDHASSSDEGQ